MDDLNKRILEALQENADLTHAELAKLVHSSAPTCMRRVQRLKAEGWIARQVAILDADKIGRELGWGLHAIVEVSLEQQTAQWLDDFERVACASAVVPVPQPSSRTDWPSRRSACSAVSRRAAASPSARVVAPGG